MTYTENVRRDGALTEGLFVKFIANKAQITGAHRNVVEELNLNCEFMPDHSHGDVSFDEYGITTLAEVKGKDATEERHNVGEGYFGLEIYRLEGILRMKSRFDRLLYAILETKTGEWKGANFIELERQKPEIVIDGPTLVGGNMKTRPIRYWHKSLWRRGNILWTWTEARRAILARKQFEFVSGETPTLWRAE